MAAQLVSLAEAGRLLGVSPERVRQLVVAGDLAGVRFGNAWAVPVDAVFARRQRASRRGRPLGPRRAWEEIVAGRVDLDDPGRYRARADPTRYDMTKGDTDHLVNGDGILVSGLAAARDYGQLVGASSGPVDLYLAEPTKDALSGVVAAGPNPLGSVVLRVVPAREWAFLDERLSAERRGRPPLAPRAAVALDLMESGDPRHWTAAEALLRDPRG